MPDKTSKTLADFEGQTPIHKAELEIFDTKANHNKFWRIYVYQMNDGYFIARHWGRNGTKGQQMVESSYSRYSSLDYAERLQEEKTRKGYKPEASPLDKIVREV